jgi:hypothetical protein
MSDIPWARIAVKQIIAKCIFILFTISMASGCSGENKLNDSILNKKPVFTLKIHGFGTRYRVSVNGIEVYRENSSASQVTTSIPLNHWMRSGENIIKLVVLPSKKNTPINEKSEVNAELYVHNDEMEEQQYRIGGFNFKGLGHINETALEEYRLETELFTHDDEGELITHEVSIAKDTILAGSYEYEQKFTIPNNLPLWAFFNSEAVPNNPDLSDDEYWEVSAELRDHLKIIQDKILAGDIDDVMPLFEERNNELDKAFYYPSGVMEAKLRDSFETDIPELDMLELEGRNVSYANENNLKLASVYRNRKAAIVGNFKDSQGSIKFPIMFRQQDGKWIITR